MSTTVVQKVFKTHGEMLRILYDRGLNIKPVIMSKEILETENYYNLINGYKEPFLIQGSPNEKYKPDSSLSEIHALYRFDRNVRGLFINEVLKFENTIKTIISYNFSSN